MGNICSISISCDEICAHCLHCTAGKAAYVSKLENNLVALQTASQQLSEARDDVLTRVMIAEQQQMRRLNEVQGWISRVEALENDVGQVMNDSSQQLGNLCLGDYCSLNYKSSYKFGKKVAKLLQVATTLKGEGNFGQVAEKIPKDPLEEVDIDQPIIVGQQLIFDKVWRCLGENHVRMIGLYGKGGVGKTILLKQINNRFCHEQQGFDIVIWATVSKELKLEKIQEDIGRKLGLCNESWKRRDLEEKAQDIFSILRKKKFALLLDDIWKPVDLTKLGVPLPSPKLASKIVFTTRSLDVCGQMEADEEFEVMCLIYDEAWTLFQEKAGRDILDSHTGIAELAQAMVEECDGLPLALITIGRAMAHKKTLEEWSYAIQLLKKSITEFPGMEKVYPRLKFSYDSLPDTRIRSCFLYCVLFPEDYKISKSSLIDCWLGEGLLDGSDGSAGRYQGYSIIGILIRACLLEEEGDDCIKMHDVVRDMALWVACDIEKEEEEFLVLSGAELTKAPEVEKWEGIRKMSLMKNKIEILSEIPACPDLQTLFLSFNHLRMINSDFFQFMPCLKVLNLSYNDHLTKLPSGISKLVLLQHLDLSGTAIKWLPEELKFLINLKCLSLDNTFYLRSIPKQLISSLCLLQVLRMFRCSASLLVEELLSLEFLNVLTITLNSSNDIEEFLSFPKVQSHTQSLCLQFLSDIRSLNLLSSANLKHLDTLQIWDCKCLEGLDVDFEGELTKIRKSYIFDSLHTVYIESCFEVKELTWLILAPNLKNLHISYCYPVNEILCFEILGKAGRKVGRHPFVKLEILRLQHLPDLKSICRKALPFPHLKEIFVVGCPNLKKLPLDSNSGTQHHIIIKGEESWWRELQWDDQATHNTFHHCFKAIAAEVERQSDEDTGNHGFEA